MGKFLNAGLVAFLTVVPLAQTRAETPGVTDKEIKVGAHIPLSGPYAIYGVLAKSIKMYFDKVNEQGGVHGRKITFLFEDDLGNPAKALEVTKKLVQRDNVFSMFASMTPTHAAVVDFLETRKVPDMFFGDPSKKSNVLGKYRFPALASAGDEAAAAAEYIVKHLKGKKVALIGLNESVAVEGFPIAKKILANNNPIVGEEMVEVGELNIQPQMAKFKAAGAEVILNMMDLAPTCSAMKTGVESGFRPQWVVPSYDSSYFLVDLAGAEVAEGTVGQVGLENEFSTLPQMKELVANWTKANPETPANLLTIYGHALGEIYVEVLKRAGKDLTRESFVAAAESVKNYKCTFCLFPINLDKTHHNVFPTLKHQVLKSGKWKAI